MAYWKKIKNTNAVPVLKDELVFDQTPTVNSTNPVTSDGVARAIAGKSGEVPVVTESDNGKILTAIYDEGGAAVEWADAPQELPSTLGTAGQVLKVNAGGTGVEWGEAGANYTAGDGINIDAQNAVSVKAGIGLEIGNTSTSETVTLHSTRVSGNFTYSFSALSADLLSKITSGGLDLTTLKVNDYSTGQYASSEVYAAICNFDSNFSSNPEIVYKQYIMGSVAKPYDGVMSLNANSVVTFDSADYQSSLSTLTLQEIQENPSDYFVALIQRNGAYDEAIGRTAYIATKMNVSQGDDTATYTGTVTIQDALNVANPLPASAVGDAGKVLTVNNAGSAEWATPSGGGGDVVVLTYGASVSYSDIVDAITQDNKRFAVQGTVTIDGYNYTVYSDEMSYFGAGQSVSWLVTITGQAYTYQIKLLGNSNWYVDKYAELPSTSGASAGQVLSLNNYSQPVWATPSGGMKWSRNTHPTVDASNGITATLSGLSVTNSACVVNVSLLIYPSAIFTTNMPSTLTFKVLQNLEYSAYYFGTLTAELSSYSGLARYRACGTVTLPYGNSELSEIVIYDPNGTSLVVSGADYEVSVGVAK